MPDVVASPNPFRQETISCRYIPPLPVKKRFLARNYGALPLLPVNKTKVFHRMFISVPSRPLPSNSGSLNTIIMSHPTPFNIIWSSITTPPPPPRETMINPSRPVPSRRFGTTLTCKKGRGGVWSYRASQHASAPSKVLATLNNRCQQYKRTFYYYYCTHRRNEDYNSLAVRSREIPGVS